MQLGAEINNFSLMMLELSIKHQGHHSGVLALGCVGAAHDAVLAVISMVMLD